jgi:hypothetical protein
MSQSAEQLEAVKAYIAKHNLEDELSNAVNQAIKLDSDDPYRVISDYLRQFAKVRRRRLFFRETATRTRESSFAPQTIKPA